MFPFPNRRRNSGNPVMTLLTLRKQLLISFCLGLLILSIGILSNAQSFAFKQTVAKLVASNKKLTKFYESTGYAPLWIGTSNLHRSRRSAFFKAISAADTHGLPVQRYNPKILKKQAQTARTQHDLAAIEVSMSQTFLTYAADIQTGLLIPKKISKDIQRKVPYRDHFSYLKNFANSNPNAFLKALPPTHPEYARLQREKLKFERIVARNSWGTSLGSAQLEPGDTGKQVIKLRNRLIAMGYLKRNLRRKYDSKLQAAVTSFQKDHGLNSDGVAGPATLSELNTPAKRRLQSIIVAMERMRWSNKDLGDRHILVNLTDFTAKIIQNNEVTFRTRSVVGANMESRRTPEFSDIMELMVINPTWHVPRSIAVTEYLPVLQEDPLALDHLILYDDFGLQVNRAMHDFNMFDEQTFPFDVKQLPSRGNALGLVKFLFPNPHNIYLHDTPEKSLFSKDRRTFSHGCVRLQQPFEFAYNLLKAQEQWPEEFFNAQLTTGMEISVNLKEPVPVHLIYRTATVPTDGRINFRSDIYGRDQLIWQALSSQGVALQTVRG